MPGYTAAVIAICAWHGTGPGTDKSRNGVCQIMLYFVEQFLNGIQLGMLLFLLAAGLTLIFGIIDLVNLAHGSLYMLGAYFAATFADWTDSFLLGALLALAATAVTGMLLEVIAVRRGRSPNHSSRPNRGTLAVLIHSRRTWIPT